MVFSGAFGSTNQSGCHNFHGEGKQKRDERGCAYHLSMKGAEGIRFGKNIQNDNEGVPQVSKGGQLLNPSLITVIFNHPIFIEKNNECILLLLDSRV